VEAAEAQPGEREALHPSEENMGVQQSEPRFERPNGLHFVIQGIAFNRPHYPKYHHFIPLGAKNFNW